MSFFFFSGSHDAKLDQKNRFVLPQNLRYGLVENGALEFTIGLGIGGCLAIYKKSDIEKIAQKFLENVHAAKYQKFFTLFFSTLHHTSCDKIGRLILPRRLKEAVGIQEEIVLAGVLNKIEIWPKEKYEAQLTGLIEGTDKDLNLAQLTEEAFALLKEKDEPCTCSEK
ncbi:MAG: hypothetical protein JW769_04180 [Parachlamydiales bacterium]|nr:hypothetical protein [Parachlamydiales bacterium]